jgi:hypothetical protein
MECGVTDCRCRRAVEAGEGMDRSSGTGPEAVVVLAGSQARACPCVRGGVDECGQAVPPLQPPGTALERLGSTVRLGRAAGAAPLLRNIGIYASFFAKWI